MSKSKCHYDVHVTFYGFDDNDDGHGHYGTAIIEFPHIHDLATEDLGNYHNPSTFACDARFIKPGTKIYVPRLMKYYIMEDGCVECEADWAKGIKHVDLYIGGNEKLYGSALISRENDLTFSIPEIIIINPPINLPVSLIKLF